MLCITASLHHRIIAQPIETFRKQKKTESLRRIQALTALASQPGQGWNCSAAMLETLGVHFAFQLLARKALQYDGSCGEGLSNIP